MQRNHRHCLIAGLTLLLTARATFAQITGATVSGGQVEGKVADGVAAFKGIPFAAAPIGELRWKPPHPVQAWQGIRKAVLRRFGWEAQRSIPNGS